MKISIRHFYIKKIDRAKSGFESIQLRYRNHNSSCTLIPSHYSTLKCDSWSWFHVDLRHWSWYDFELWSSCNSTLNNDPGSKFHVTLNYDLVRVMNPCWMWHGHYPAELLPGWRIDSGYNSTLVIFIYVYFLPIYNSFTRGIVTLKGVKCNSLFGP